MQDIMQNVGEHVEQLQEVLEPLMHCSVPFTALN